MAYMNNLDFKGISNARISSRIKQVIVLVLAIIIGMIISATVNAQDYHKNKARHFKTKYRTQINQYTNACDLLDKKKMRSPKATSTSPLLASHQDKNRKLKFR